MRPLKLLLALTGFAAVSAAASETLLVKDGLFITMKAGDEQPFVGYMTVGSDGRITAVVPGSTPVDLKADKIVEAAGKLIVPGFISAHSHLGNAQFRGLGHTETLYAWSTATSRFHRHTTAEDSYWFCLLGTHEFLRNGITTVFDMTRARPVGADSAADDGYDFNPLKAKIDGGIRFINAVPLATVRGSRKLRRREEWRQEQVPTPFVRRYRKRRHRVGGHCSAPCAPVSTMSRRAARKVTMLSRPSSVLVDEQLYRMPCQLPACGRKMIPATRLSQYAKAAWVN